MSWIFVCLAALGLAIGASQAPKEMLDRALELHRTGEHEQAIKLCVELLGAEIGQEAVSFVHNLQGISERALGMTSAAKVSFEGALNLRPDNKHAAYNLGLLMQNDVYSISEDPAALDAAVAAYNLALAEGESIGGPVERKAVLNDLSMALQEGERYEEALIALQEAVKLPPEEASSWALMSSVLHAQQRSGEALEAATQAADLEPARADLWYNLGLMHAAEKTEEGLMAAESAWERALDLDSSLMQAWAALGHACELLLTDPSTSTGAGALGYYLIYQGLPNLPPRRALAQAYWKWCPSLRYTAPFLETEPEVALGQETALPLLAPSTDRTPQTSDGSVRAQASDGRIRVGFLSAFFFRHSVGLLTQGVITQLDPKRFEVTAIFLQPQPTDEVTKAIRDGVENTLDVPASHLSRSRQMIGELGLDVLVFTEIGMDHPTYFLAFARLARRTAAFWGHACTSGISPVDAMAQAGVSELEAGGLDYFVSSDLFEGDNAQAKYTERLYLMKGLTTSFPAPFTPAEVTRSSLGIPSYEEGCESLYLVPQTLYKLHPDFDDLMRAVLTEDASGCIVLPTAQDGTWTDMLVQRITLSLGGELLKRVVMVPRMGFGEFLGFVEMADVVLDPFPVGGGRSSFEIFSTGTPVVMLYNRTSVLQLTYGMYNAMGLDQSSATEGVDLITYSNEAFVASAVRVATDKGLQSRLRQLIRSRNSRLYDRKDVVHEWEDFLETISSSPRPAAFNGQIDKGEEEKEGQGYARDSNSNSAGQDKVGATHLNDGRELFHWEKRPWGWALGGGGQAGKEALMPTTLDDELLYAMQVQLETGHSDGAVLYVLEVWKGQSEVEVARAFAEGIGKLDTLQFRWISKQLQQGVRRRERDVALKGTIEGHPFQVHLGDDLHQVSHWYSYQYGLSNESREAMFQQLAKSLPEHSGEVWLAARSGDELAGTGFGVGLNQGPPAPPVAASDVSEPPPACITLGMTTCRRLELFRGTLASLQRALAGEEGGASASPLSWEGLGWKVCQAVVVDDASSAEERREMMALLPDATWVFKAPEDKGHASSMNALLSLVSSPYLFYLEDDWVVKPEAWGEGIPASFLDRALAVLRDNEEGLAQVLINDQSSRGCAEGWECPPELQGTQAGWPRQSKVAGVEYRAHEFGASSAHAFSYWPGFSLNPALWEVDRIRKVYSSSFNRDFSFATSHSRFEQLASLQLADAGLRVAYLPDVTFEHAGGEVSAYTLNDQHRPWDA